jgi:hypothetical protein
LAITEFAKTTHAKILPVLQYLNSKLFREVKKVSKAARRQKAIKLKLDAKTKSVLKGHSWNFRNNLHNEMKRHSSMH